MKQQYGALPWRKDRRGSIQLLLVTSRRRGRWIVPKGWPVEGRAPYMAAALEAFEEAGVIGEIWPSALAHYHYMKEGRDGSLQRCRVSLFALRVRGTLTHWPERGERRRRWLPVAEAAELVDDPELARIIGMIRAEPRMLDRRLDGEPYGGPASAGPPAAGVRQDAPEDAIAGHRG